VGSTGSSAYLPPRTARWYAAWLKLAGRGAVVSHETALAPYDLAPSRSREIALTLPLEQRPRAKGSRAAVRFHTTRVPLSRIEASHRFGLRITSRARTIVGAADIGADASVVIEAIARAVSTGLVTPRELHEAVRSRSARVRRLVARAVIEADAVA
jgi:hypothetical protein